jgi:tetratricopeptide (TPR) repeat protein
MVTKRVSSSSERVAKLISAALNLQQVGETVEALQVLERAREESPDVAAIHLVSGLIQRDAGRLQEAETSLRRAVELEPGLGEAVQSLGLLLLARERGEEAIDWLKRHLELEPANPVTLRALSTTLPRMGREEEASQLLNRAWHRTHNPEAGIVYGRHLIRMGQAKEAEALLRQVSDEAPQPKVLVEWAYALAMLQECEKAEHVLLRIIDIDPRFDRAWRGLTDCYIPLGRSQDALMAADEAVAVNPGHYRNWYAKANALLSLQRYTDAYEASIKGIECVPGGDPEARPVLQELYLQAVESLLQLGRTGDALEKLGEARREFPTGEHLLEIEVSVLNTLGRAQQALQVWQEAASAGLKMEGSLPPLYFETLHLAGHAAEARSFVQPMLLHDRERRLQLLGRAGLSLYERGQIAAALSVFEQLADIAPDMPQFASNLGFLLTGEGRLPEAEAFLARAKSGQDEAASEALVLANLGYLYLIQDRLAQAAGFLEQAEAAAPEEAVAILRVAVWRAGRVSTDPVPHPTRWLSIRSAARANLVTLKLAQGRVSEAAALAAQMIGDEPDEAWGYAIQGWVHQAAADHAAAKQSWSMALDRTVDEQDQAALRQWLGAPGR